MEIQESVLLRRVGRMDPVSVPEFEALGGFSGIRKALSMEKEEILEEISRSNLKGRGGAGYPAGRKWKSLYRIEGDTKYIVCNADEGEPGTFKDRVLLEETPLSVIEGMLIAGYVFGSKQGYIYIRGEYRRIQKIFETALENAEDAGYLGKDILGVPGFDYSITVVSGGGAYVCGENSAMLNSIEGKTGRPRIKPPHLAEVGLYGKPTLVNNVETLCCVPIILEEGSQKFLSYGTTESGGTKLVSISGHVKNRGVFDVGLGISLRQLIMDEKYGGGTSTGRKPGFFHMGGQSGPIGFPEQLDTPYTYETLAPKGLAVGSGAIVVLDDSVCIVEYIQKVFEFFVHESCGKCTPCRLGTTRILELLTDFVEGRAKDGDVERLEYMARQVSQLSACGLGQSVNVALMSALRHRRGDFEAHINGGACPAGACACHENGRNKACLTI